MQVSQASNIRRAARSLQAEATARRVIPALAAEGVDLVLLKGPALAAWLYPGEELDRGFGDLDLLVRPDSFDRAVGVLQGLGYVRGQVGWDAISVSWRAPDGLIDVDLHRSLVGAEAEPCEVWRALRSRRRESEHLGVEVPTLDETGLAMHAATHAAQHVLEGASKPAEDLRRALDVAEGQTWEGAAELARRIGAEAAFGAGLRQLPEGAELAERLALGREMPLDVALRASEDPPPLVLGIEQLGRIRGTRARVRFALAKVFPSPAQMRSTSALAAGGRAGLLAAYLLRPAQVVARLPGAIARHRSLSEQRAREVDQDDVREGEGR